MTDTTASAQSRKPLNVQTKRADCLSLAEGHCVNGLLNPRRPRGFDPAAARQADRGGKIAVSPGAARLPLDTDQKPFGVRVGIFS